MVNFQEVSEMGIRNEGGFDRVVRVILGIILLALGLLKAHGALGIVLDVVGVVVLLTGLTGFCALYRLIGVSTCRRT